MSGEKELQKLLQSMKPELNQDAHKAMEVLNKFSN